MATVGRSSLLPCATDMLLRELVRRDLACHALGLVLLHPLGAYPCCSGIHVNKKRGSNISVKRLKWIRGFWVAVVLGGSVSLSDPRSYQLFYL